MAGKEKSLIEAAYAASRTRGGHRHEDGAVVVRREESLGGETREHDARIPTAALEGEDRRAQRARVRSERVDREASEAGAALRRWGREARRAQDDVVRIAAGTARREKRVEEIAEVHIAPIATPSAGD
jgi:hypothetical protein